MTDTGHEIRLVFRSTYDLLDIIEQVADRLSELVGLDEDSAHWVSVAVRESAINAIKHGNQDDPTKFVEIVIRLNRQEIQIKVTDQGDGFVPSEVPDPTDDDNLELPSGRGLMLMRSFMSLVEYNDKGNSVRMEKRRPTE